MKALIYTDNHFCTNSSIIRSRGKNFSTRLENQIESINWAEKLADDLKCDQIFHLGDFFDKSELNSEELTALKEIKWSKLPHTFLCGNHEIESADLKYNSLNALSRIGRVITNIEEDNYFGCNIIWLPYILESNRKPLIAYLKELEKKNANTFTTQEYKHTIILSHNDLKMNYGVYKSTQGFDLDEIYNHCDYFINGHIHNQKQINNKMLNLGNLTGQNFGEDAFNYKHCVAVLEVDSCGISVKLIENPHSLNFYKLEIDRVEDLDKYLPKLKNNSALTIKAPLDLIPTLKEEVRASDKIIEYRFVGVNKITKDSTNINSLIRIGDKECYSNYVRSVIGESKILEEELNLL